MARRYAGAVLFLTVFLVSALLVASPAQAGYWKIQGEPTVTFGNNDGSRTWNAQGTNIEIVEYDSRHVVITKSGMVGGGFNTMTFRSDWGPPAQVLPGEIINLTVKSAVTHVGYERTQWPSKFETPTCMWNGVGGPAYVIKGEDITATRAGESRTLTNTSSRAKAPATDNSGGAATLRIGFPTNYSGGFAVSIPYVWVPGNAPQQAGRTGAATGATGGAPTGGAPYTTTGGPGGAAATGTPRATAGGAGGVATGGTPYNTAPTTPERIIFSTVNDNGVSNGGVSPGFTLNQPTTITYIMTYHWNHGRGAPGGTIAIRSENGVLYGPWSVAVNNGVYWEVRGNLTLPAGRYTVIDSDPATWARNEGSGGFGHVVIKGR